MKVLSFCQLIYVPIYDIIIIEVRENLLNTRNEEKEMRVNYKGCGRDFNFRVAEISFTENELRTMERIEKAMNVKGWDLNIITDGYASCKVDDYEEYTEFVEDYKNAKKSVKLC